MSIDEILANATHRRHDTSIDLKQFDCDDVDLNDFYHRDCSKSQDILLCVTYVIENENETIAFYSLLNDKISKEEGSSNNQWNKLREQKFDEDHNGFKSYPCVKLARLGVSKHHQSKGIGAFLINHIKDLFVDNNKTGCRFITVDAYNNPRTLKFYEDNGFIHLPLSEANKGIENPKTKLLYFDLIQITNAQKANSEEEKASAANNGSSKGEVFSSEGSSN